MAEAARPSYGELLTALESEFRPVDRDSIDSALDQLALPLFGLEAARLAERAIALGRAAWAAVPDEGEPACRRTRSGYAAAGRST